MTSQGIEPMFEILARAGAKLQILVLTCRERGSRGLPGYRLRLQAIKTRGGQ
jgi:hypothetical protein